MRKFKQKIKVDRDLCVRGLDVSDHQKRIDWQAAKAAGYEFVYVKATQATRSRDPKFRSYIRGAQDAGLLVGAYHFAWPDADPRDAIDEAKNLADCLDNYDLPPVLDVEGGSIFGKQLLEWCDDFIRTIEASCGRYCVLYTSPAYYSMVKIKAWSELQCNRPLWVAHWDCEPGDPTVWQPHSKIGMSSPSLPPGFSGWDFWQFDAAKVPFSEVLIDRNFFNGDFEDLVAFCEFSKKPDLRKQWCDLFKKPEWQPASEWRIILNQLTIDGLAQS